MSEKRRHITIDVLLAALLGACVVLVVGMAYIIWQFIL